MLRPQIQFHPAHLDRRPRSGRFHRPALGLLTLTAALLAAPANASAPDARPPLAPSATIRVDPATVLVERARSPLGINLNYLRDADAQRPPQSRPLAAALAELRPGFVRWPGGEKSDNYLWAVPPDWQPATHRLATPHSWPGPDPRIIQDGAFRLPAQTFDDFMALRRAVGFEPVIVVPYDVQFHPESRDRPTREQLLRNAEEWVRYANVTRGHGVTYWEIGNESDMDMSYNGRVPDLPTYAADVREFSRRMKAVDPSIKIGLNASTEQNFVELLERIHADVDFLAVHPYPVWGWGSYDHYRAHAPDLADKIILAERALARADIPAAEKRRITIAATETNTIDWHPTAAWPGANDTGRALVAFELLGRQLQRPRVEFVAFWNTRWVNEDPPVNNALRADNTLHPQGRALAIWGRFLRERLVAATSDLASLIPFASHSPATGELVVFLLNKELTAADATVHLPSGTPPAANARVWQFRGASPTDPDPAWEQLPELPVTDSALHFFAPPLSITVLQFFFTVI